MTVLRFIIRVIYRLLFNVKITGLENIPDDDGSILAPNHISWLDPVLVVGFCPKPLKMMAKAELFNNKLYAWFFNLIGAFPIHRGDADITAIKTCLRYLKNNETILMFPHGTRIHQGEDIPIKEGAVLIALKAKKNIIPAYISGDYKFRKNVTLTIGKPFDLSPYFEEKLSPSRVKELTKDVWEAMKALDEGKSVI